MKHGIDPTVDCVFKAILAKKKNKPALIHFLNAVMKLETHSRIRDVTILNPYNEGEFLEGKLTVVDVKAKDEQGNQYQIEIQLSLKKALEARMLYTWSSIYFYLLEKGEKFEELKQVVSIWILKESLFPKINDHHLPFSIYNIKHKLPLSDHLLIHVIQLPKWEKRLIANDELDRWLYLFTERENVDIDHPPEILKIKEMNLVMETLKKFSENKEDFFLYQSRRIAQIQANTDKAEKEKLQADYQKALDDLDRVRKEKDAVQKEIEAAQKEMEAAQKEKETEQKEKEEAQKEKERYLALLKQAGIDPNDN